MGTPSRGYGSRAVLVGGALVLMLCVLATASGNGLSWTAPDRELESSDSQETEPQDNPASAEETADEEPAENNDRSEGPAWLPAGRIGALLLLGVLITVVIGMLARLRLSLRRRKLDGDRLQPTLVGVAPEDVVVIDDEPLASALDAALEDLTLGSARNSIVAAWLRLEEAAESDHFARNPADTPSEFVERVLASYSLDAGAIGRLAGLYREARFSEHPMTEQQREDAATCLATLLGGLRTPLAGGRR